MRKATAVMVVAIVLLATPGIFVAGVFVSGTFVSNLLVANNGVESFEGEERAFAEAAGQTEEIFFKLPGPGMWTTAYHVVEVRACPNPPTYTPSVCRDGVCHEPRFLEGSKFSAEIRTYTFFGILAGEVIRDCEGTTLMGR